MDAEQVKQLCGPWLRIIKCNRCTSECSYYTHGSLPDGWGCVGNTYEVVCPKCLANTAVPCDRMPACDDLTFPAPEQTALKAKMGGWIERSMEIEKAIEQGKRNAIKKAADDIVCRLVDCGPQSGELVSIDKDGNIQKAVIFDEAKQPFCCNCGKQRDVLPPLQLEAGVLWSCSECITKAVTTPTPDEDTDTWRDRPPLL